MAVLGGGQRLFRHRVETEPRRQHQPLLRAGDGDVDPPFVVTIVDRGQRRDRVDHEQCGMARVIDRGADFGNAACHPGRGFVVDDADRLDLVRAVGRELFFDLRRIDAVPPIAGHKVDFEPEPPGHRPPQAREMAGLEHQHPVARRQRVRQAPPPTRRCRTTDR